MFIFNLTSLLVNSALPHPNPHVTLPSQSRFTSPVFQSLTHPSHIPKSPLPYPQYPSPITIPKSTLPNPKSCNCYKIGTRVHIKKLTPCKIEKVEGLLPVASLPNHCWKRFPLQLLQLDENYLWIWMFLIISRFNK